MVKCARSSRQSFYCKNVRAAHADILDGLHMKLHHCSHEDVILATHSFLYSRAIQHCPSGLNFMYDKISRSFAKKRDINSDRFSRNFTNFHGISWGTTFMNGESCQSKMLRFNHVVIYGFPSMAMKGSSG